MIEYGKKFLLLSQGDKEKKTLVVGDLHIGYEEEMNLGGIDLGERRFKKMLEEFKEIFEKVGKRVEKVVLLGDLKHDFSKLGVEEKEKIISFFDFLEKNFEKAEIVVIRGNHDNYLLSLTSKKRIMVEKNYFFRGDLFIHGDYETREMWQSNVKRIFMGHLHPSIRLNDGIKKEVFKCFLEGEVKGKKVVVLPSFAEIGEGIDVREIAEEKVLGINWGNFKVLVVGEEKIYDFGRIKEIE